MKWNLAAALLTVLVVDLHEPPPADACGVKLTVKSSAPRKAVARTSNPSDVLLLGEPPRRLEIDLSAAGHRVDVAPNTAAAKKKPYAVVVTDAKLQNEARSSYPNSVVVVRSGDVTADMRSVEKQVARKPVRADESRAVVAARPTRAPIAAGPAQDPSRKVVAVKEPSDAPPVADPPPTPAPERVTTTPRPAVEVRPTPTAAEPREPKPAKVARPVTLGDAEVYFGFNSFRSGGQGSIALNRAVRYLSEKTDVSVIVEGHADPTGTPEANLDLAQRRAEFVRDYLVSNGIDSSRIEVVSYGDTRLKYGRADRRNRRAAIVAK